MRIGRTERTVSQANLARVRSLIEETQKFWYQRKHDEKWAHPVNKLSTPEIVGMRPEAEDGALELEENSNIY